MKGLIPIYITQVIDFVLAFYSFLFICSSFNTLFVHSNFRIICIYDSHLYKVEY